MAKYTHRVSFTCTAEQKRRIQEAAALDGITVSEFIRRALTEYLAVWADGRD